MDLLRLSLSRLGPLCEVRTHITRVGSSKEKNYLPFLCTSKTLFVVSRKITNDFLKVNVLWMSVGVWDAPTAARTAPGGSDTEESIG